MTDNRPAFGGGFPEDQFSGMTPHHQDERYMWYEIKGRLYPVFNQYGTTKKLMDSTTKPIDTDESQPHKAGTDTKP